MGTLRGFPNPPAMVRVEQSSPLPTRLRPRRVQRHLEQPRLVLGRRHPGQRANLGIRQLAHAQSRVSLDGNPRRVPKPSRALAPPSEARLRQRGGRRQLEMGTLEGFPNPPAMVRRRQSRRAPHAWSARATRTFSRAVAASNPTRHASQCAQETAPCSPQPHCSSNCRIQVSNRCMAASRCADNEAISRPNSSTGNMGKTIRVFSGGGKRNQRGSTRGLLVSPAA
jgi:hypothetical protein